MIFTLKKVGVAEYISIGMSIFLLGLIVSAPGVCAAGAKYGLKICAGVLVPSLFPFSVPVLFLIGTNTFKNSKYTTLLIFILSMLGGYPIGAKLISQSFSEGNIERLRAKEILPFCVNAGPAFIVVAIGKGLLKNTKLGYVLLISHILSAIILFLIFSKSFKKSGKTKKLNSVTGFSDNFVSSIHSASTACISICAYVVFFSVVNEYIGYFSIALKPLNVLLYFTEVTSALKRTGNIFLISFLLGFAGISIWMQVFSLTSEIKPDIVKFAFVRILHGAISTVLTFVIIKVFKINIAVMGNGVKTYERLFYTDLSLSLSLLVMVILLVVSVISKKHSGNIMKDVL